MTKHALELEPGHKRSRRRRLLAFALIALAILLALLYLTCGRGLGGKGAGKGAAGSARPVLVDAGPVRCQVRVTASGITVGGKPTSREEAVAACKRTTAADVIVTGDARQGDWDELRTALEAAGVELMISTR